jgi:hypothetical protein
MPPTTPLLLVDNVFDTVNQYPNGTVSTSSERPGHEGFRVADYRRERTSWQAATTTAFQYVAVDCGVGVTRIVDCCFIDRGHNLWGKTVQITGDNGSGGGANSFAALVPAAGTLGGDPTTGWCVTEEGAIYTLHPAMGFGTPGSGFSAKRRYLVYVQDSWAPVIPGIILGMRSQLDGYSSTFDEDAAERTQSTAVSQVGYRGTDKTYSWRVLDLALSYIGVATYDAMIRDLRRLLFTKNEPAAIFMDWGTRPERGWMYQYDGTSWTAPKKRVYRETKARFREVGASLV